MLHAAYAGARAPAPVEHVDELHLSGEGTLWVIALYAEADAVGDAAIVRLAQLKLYQNTASGLPVSAYFA